MPAATVRGIARQARAFCLGLFFVGAGAQPALAGEEATPAVRSADFASERASPDARRVADRVVRTGDNHATNARSLPFAIVDKKDARVYVFDANGRLLGAAAALLGAAKGDDSVPGIGDRELSAVRPWEKTTPAGRFVASLGDSTRGEDVLWVDYEGAVSMHRVLRTNTKERRLQRLATPTPLDNRISFGCINVPVKFYEGVVRPAFTATYGIVYVLPEIRALRSVFTFLDVD